MLLLVLAQCGGSDEVKRPGASAGSAGAAGNVSGGSVSGGSAGTGRQDDPAGSAGAPDAPLNACLSPSAEGYEPVWMPPHAVPGACTSQQISQSYALCGRGSSEYDAAECRAFNLKPDNNDCLSCLFSAVGDEPSAAIIIMPRDHRQTNVGGCIALLDGDSADDSCGARAQASDVCRYGACVAACNASNTSEDWDDCSDAASVACGQYVAAAACRSLPRNARCGYPTFKEYFLGIGDVFCGSGPGGTGEGGSGGMSGATAGGDGGTGGNP